jgi:hypothetical protein
MRAWGYPEGIRRIPDLPDPRRETKNTLHRLTDILVIATCAVIAGADGWDQVAEYGRRKEAFFRRFLALPNGIPSHDTFDRVFAKLDPAGFADRFGRWAAEACEEAGLVHVAVDGKSARRSPGDTFTGCLHRVEAWAVEDRLLLGVRSVPDGGHEITTPELVAGLDRTGAVVTIDAAGCQKATVEQVRARGGEYVVCVKGNQKGLRDAVAGVFDRAAATDVAGCDTSEAVGGGHGRAEERYVTVIHDPAGLPGGWAGVMVGRERQVGGGGEREYGPLLPDQPAGDRRGAGGLHPQPLGDRERVALGARRVVPGGRESGAGGARGGRTSGSFGGSRCPSPSGPTPRGASRPAG